MEVWDQALHHGARGGPGSDEKIHHFIKGQNLFLGPGGHCFEDIIIAGECFKI